VSALGWNRRDSEWHFDVLVCQVGLVFGNEFVRVGGLAGLVCMCMWVVRAVWIKRIRSDSEWHLGCLCLRWSKGLVV